MTDATLSHKLPFSFARDRRVLVQWQDASPVVIHHGELEPHTLLEIRRVLRQPFKVCAVDEARFGQHLHNEYQRDASEARQLMEDLGNEMSLSDLAGHLPGQQDLLDMEDDAPIIRLINAMLGEAIKLGASDIHIETYETRFTIRFRIDGILREILQPQRQLAAVFISRIKIMAQLDIAEKRIPQDGRISLRIGGRAVDVRVSTLPSSHGERVVLRLLDKNTVRLALSHLGMTDALQAAMAELVRKPWGIILVTGPTGSGKSTTLYAALSEINSHERNILTVEDPVEYDLDGIGQTQVNTKVDMTFARGLRAILRQDPDVVMIGEIRDTETAKIAVQASLTGHLVFSTLHTNTSIGAIARLRDMGVEPFLLASSLTAVLAQRLVRTLCPQCKTCQPLDDARRQRYGFGPKTTQLWQAAGCEHCNHTGYRGRTALHELVVVDEAVRKALNNGASEDELETLIRSTTPALRDDGLAKVLQGITTLEEVINVSREGA
ncbi:MULTISPECIES: type II secretion system ATPase GspE [unclassified Leclercia]|uniref:Type II secretion system protein E n=1 Tax=Leclercia barmai TaxID=2785629 RepID=A0ABS7S1Y0_9ENTR|nr:MULTISPECIES: type II secretion system ATPase GspE [unclassified Leclercia]MBZ0059556.1 type II secretion system ATPase GspE [Leclercia sp. EMC7]MCM5697311.1 type II secretion system ATPase GspE [Leclercia sp. LTM01]MCM5702092.1 type II secretion system ATPase GspE [Leclercia sp. LTM14]